MKKVLFALAGLMISACMTAGNLNAQETTFESEEEMAAFEAQYFLNADEMANPDTDGAKFAEQLNDDEDDGDAKCWFWGYRYYRPAYYVAPTYYYHTWYVPCYYVPFRLITYTVPTVVATPSVAVASTTTTTVWKSSNGKAARGAIIDKKVPAHSPLAKMGLRSGDIVTSVDGRPVNSLVDVRRIKANSKITYVRGGDVRVASKQLTQTSSKRPTISKGGADVEGGADVNTDLSVLKKTNGKKMSLYEYYDMLEKEAENN